MAALAETIQEKAQGPSFHREILSSFRHCSALRLKVKHQDLNPGVKVSMAVPVTANLRKGKKAAPVWLFPSTI